MRKVLFWIHLTAGSVAGLVILMMCVTGVVLTYEQQIISWAERDFRRDPVPGASRLAPEQVVERLRQKGKGIPGTLTMRSDPSAPIEAVTGREPIVFIHPYTGEVLGHANTSLRGFFRSMTEMHRWFAAEGAARVTARSITGAANLAFLFLALSGLYLWVPRVWSWRHVRPVLWFRGGLIGRARDFNWHNAIGVWCAIPLIFVVVSGAVMSYPWANALVYTLTGTEAPPPPSAARDPRAPEPPDANLTGLNAQWARAEQQAPGWQVISLRVPTSDRAPFVFTIDKYPRRGRPDQRVMVTLTRAGDRIRVETFDSYNKGRRVRSWLRYIHTGEAGGLIGQTIAGVSSAGGAVLVWTGIALALRRFLSWRKRKSSPVSASNPQEEPAVW